jgi:hypothetical protein
MSEIDDLVQGRAKQVLLSVVARLAHRSSPEVEKQPSENHAASGVGNPKSQENRAHHPQFLQKRLLPHRRSARNIRPFPVLHRQLRKSTPTNRTDGLKNDGQWGVVLYN